ncbi:MAG: hypothetical protein COC19_05445 [SAR86 cluster bacterium]|uniref:Amidase domain-containing protein n=1 Tax=SAR86 cluster bacterium TaxID=2030880 RepID=A0A2A4ML04_9GAMM|nr:MAG: hypothetical protein COC19_05445 [SAR86 cluster bacterium]
MLSVSEYQELDAISLAAGIKEKQFSAIEVLNCAQQKAMQLNPQLNAIVTELDAPAKQQALEFDANPALLEQSLLAGAPFLVKDISPIKGLPQTNSSELFKGLLAKEDAAVVKRFYEAGLVVFGKTNTPELCLTITTESKLTGPCHNPWNLDHSTGGSSGGSAAAVAAGIVPIAHATDGGGSIRVPASCCGVFGLKPSRGLSVIEDGYAQSWSGFSVGHVVSRSVRDSAACLDQLKLSQPSLYPLPPGPDSYLAQLNQKPGDLTIALQNQHPDGFEIDPQCQQAIEHAAQLCRDLGYKVIEAAPAIDYRAMAGAMSVIINVHTAQLIAPRLEQLQLSLAQSPLEVSTKAMAKRGMQTSASEYLSALDKVKSAELVMAEFHKKYAVVLSPVLALPPAKLGWLDMNSEDQREYGSRFRRYSGFASLFNGTGAPSMSVPLFQSDKNLPIGVMFSGAWGQDLQLLQLARQLEQLDPWIGRKPAIY